MVDHLSPEDRSALMAKIRAKKTMPERLLWRTLRSLHIRYRGNFDGVSGRPDAYLPEHQAAVFVHGCFWHGHEGCSRATIPKTRTKFWKDKIKRNRRRDRTVALALRKRGISVYTIWTCRLTPAYLRRRLRIFCDNAEPRRVAVGKA